MKDSTAGKGNDTIRASLLVSHNLICGSAKQSAALGIGSGKARRAHLSEPCGEVGRGHFQRSL
jgi:hypothetical protein